MKIKKFIPNILFPLVASLIVVSLIVVNNARTEETSFNVGYKIYDFDYVDEDGDAQTLTTAIWYPTDEKPIVFTYHLGPEDYQSFVSKIDICAPITKKKAPYPLVIFIHGGYGCGLNIAYFAESLASQGYIVIGADYIDTIAPDFSEQIALGRIKEGNVAAFLPVLKVANKFADTMNAERDTFLWYISKYRINPTSFLINKMLELNKQEDSFFYEKIDEDAIGVIGHSLGGTMIFGMTGGHPDKSVKDERIKTALVLSAGVYPFEDYIHNIDIPIMIMSGDNDETMNPEVPRELAYEETNPPKFYLILKDATHFSFTNLPCFIEGDALFDCRQSSPQTQVINKYGSAFFNKYLKGDISGEEQLNTSDSGLVYYQKEEEPGEISSWGEKPEPASGLPFGGIDKIFKEFWKIRKNRFKMHLYPGLNMISVPLDPGMGWQLSDLINYIGKDNATVIVWYNPLENKFSSYLPSFPLDAPSNAMINGENGYIVNVLSEVEVIFTGSAWDNMAPSVESLPNGDVWAFAVAGLIYDENGVTPVTNNFSVTVKNLRTGNQLFSHTGLAGDGIFEAAFVDLSRRSVVKLGDIIEVAVLNSSGEILAGPIKHHINSIDLIRASVILNLRIGDIIPEKSALLPNFPNPFNPETWLPYQLADGADVRIDIHDASGCLVQAIDLGYKGAGTYISRNKAGYWNGTNKSGGLVASGVYFYTIKAGNFMTTRKMLMVK